jgi:hypothetical protein
VIAIFLTNCIQKIQLARQDNEQIDSAELELLQTAQSLLVDTAYVIEGEVSLAAGVLRMWKQFYNDVWAGEVSIKLLLRIRVLCLLVSVTPRIASLFEKLACAYDSQLSLAGDNL